LRLPGLNDTAGKTPNALRHRYRRPGLISRRNRPQTAPAASCRVPRPLGAIST